MCWSSQKKIEGILCTGFVKICVLSQSIAYLTGFQDIHTFTYNKKTLLHTLLLLASKIVESL